LNKALLNTLDRALEFDKFQSWTPLITRRKQKPTYLNTEPVGLIYKIKWKFNSFQLKMKVPDSRPKKKKKRDNKKQVARIQSCFCSMVFFPYVSFFASSEFFYSKYFFLFLPISSLLFHKITSIFICLRLVLLWKLLDCFILWCEYILKYIPVRLLDDQVASWQRAFCAVGLQLLDWWSVWWCWSWSSVWWFSLGWKKKKEKGCCRAFPQFFAPPPSSSPTWMVLPLLILLPPTPMLLSLPDHLDLPSTD
jgi:hypothetical protein